MSTLVIVFVRNVQIGRVKSRLAQTLGDENALQVYIRLLDHTAQAVQQVMSAKAVYYRSHIDEADEFMVPVFHKFMQQGQSLGQRLEHAFIKSFARGYEKVLIVGCDSFELEPAHMEEALRQLENNDAVLGPSTRGGCYLLGLRLFRKELFANKDWNSDNVLVDLMLELKQAGMTYHLLPALTVVENKKDLPEDIRRLYA